MMLLRFNKDTLGYTTLSAERKKAAAPSDVSGMTSGAKRLGDTGDPEGYFYQWQGL